MAPHDRSDEELFEGRRFPDEAEWLNLPEPRPGELGDLRVANDFVDRTLRAVLADRQIADRRASDRQASDRQADHQEPDADLDSGGYEAGSAAFDRALPNTLLQSFAAPEPSADFVARTLAATTRDRRARWQELLARHVAPEPSPEFVARTLTALASDDADQLARRQRERVWRAPFSPRAWPLLAIAAAALFWLLLSQPVPAPLELRLARNAPPAFAYSHAASPLPAVLASLSQRDDPTALSDGGADGAWLWLGGKP